MSIVGRILYPGLGTDILKRWVKVVGSVLAAFLGVQSEANRRRDFTQGQFPLFVMAGIALTAVFLLTVYGLSQLVLTVLQ